ncbi:hypothetical protein ACXYMU_08470 [Pontibacter sp. CAU 1760]
MKNKLFLCKWGDWDDHGINAYEAREKEVTENYFTEENGYEAEDRNAIITLDVGEQYDVSSGNQIVERLK